MNLEKQYKYTITQLKIMSFLLSVQHVVLMMLILLIAVFGRKVWSDLSDVLVRVVAGCFLWWVNGAVIEAVEGAQADLEEELEKIKRLEKK
jgi:xanthine/uracil permease